MNLSEYRPLALDCDLGLWLPTSWHGHVISAATDGPYSHVCAVVWWGESLWQLGYQEGRGGYGSPLKTEVEKHPGKIHIFRLRDQNFDRTGLKNSLKEHLGWNYNWGAIKTIAFFSLPFVRWFRYRWAKKIVEKESRKTAGGICSSYIAERFAEQGIEFIRGKPFSLITPNDIWSSPILKPIGVLDP